MRQVRNKMGCKRWLAVPAVIVIVCIILLLFYSGEIQTAENSAKIALSKNSITIKQGITYNISIKNKPDGVKAVWSSKNIKIAKVNRGVVTGLKKGKTEVICKIAYKKGGKKMTETRKVNVTVRENKQVYPKHKPYGKGIGAKPGRVVWSHNPKSVSWDGKGYK